MAKLLSNTRVYGTATVDTILFVNGFIGASSTNSGSLQVAGGIGVSGGGFFGGTVTATNFVGAISGTASLATDLAGGAAGQLLYQIAPNDTGFVSTGTPGQILISQGSNSPIFVNTTTFAVGLAVNLLGGAANQFVYQTGPNATGFISTGSMYVGRAVLADGLSTGGISTATNLAGGTTGQVPYQTAPGATSFFGPGTSGQILVSQGANAAGPVFTNTSSIYVKDSDISTNLRNGSAGQIPYQTGGSATAFVGPGVAGQVLTSGGVSGPIYVNTSSLYVGRAVIADSASGVDTADKIKTIARPDNSAHYLTFVDSNNTVATGEVLYTSSTVAVNPATGAVGLGTSAPSERLELLGAADTARIKITNSTVGRGSLLGQGASGFYWQPTSNSDVFELRNATGTGLFLLNPNTQYVGIGTSGPSERVHVDGAAADTRIRVSATDGTNYRGFEVRAGTTFKGGLLYRTTEGNVMQIWGPNTTSASMYIDSSNFVGVGTSGPAYNLDVRGSLGAGGGGTNFVVTSDSDAMTRIGISLAGTGTSRLNIQDRLNWYQSFYVGTVLKARLGVGGGDDLAWEVGGTERVRFTGTGRVGIATTDPQTTLHVNGTARVSSTSEFESRVYMGALAYERNPANAIQEWGGASSSFSLNIQDGSGRVNYYWNTNGTPSPTQTVANEDSFRLLMGTDGPLIGFYGWDGTSSAAGTAITWTEIIRASMLETNPYFKGTIIPIGSGTTNYVTKFTAAGTIGNSQIFDNGTNIGIGTTNPYSRLTLISESNTTGISLFTSAYIAAREWGTRIWKSDTGGGIPLKFDTQEAGVWYDSISISHGRSNSHPSLRTWNTTQLATDAGNVGIGTTAPLNKLHQAGGKYLLISDDGSYGQLQISAPGGGEATILFGSTGSGQNSGGYTNTGVIGIGAYGNTRDTLVLGTGYSAGTLFLKGGNAGISVVSPSFKLDISGTGNASSDFRAPIFYDNNNTAYYADPASTSNFNYLNVGASTGVASQLRVTSAEQYSVTVDHNYANNSVTGGAEAIFIRNTNANDGNFAAVGLSTNGTDGQHHRGIVRAYRDTGATGVSGRIELVVRQNGAYSRGLYVDGNANAFADNQMRAPIFYDSNNTAYYVDPAAGTSALFAGNVGIGTTGPGSRLHVSASTPTGIGSVPSGVTGIFDSNTNNYLLFRNSADNATYSGIAMQDNNVGGFVVFGNAGGAGDLMYVAGYNGGALQYGTANTIDPAGRTTAASWNSTGLQVNNGDMRAPIYYDSNNTAFYIDPASTSNVNTFNGFSVNANIATGRGTYGAATLNLILNASSADANGICGIDFRSGGNYPSDGAQIYYASSVSGAEQGRLWIRVENDGSSTVVDDIYIRAGRIFYDAVTVDGTPSDPGHIFRRGSSDRMYVYSDNTTEVGSFRAPIFYDSNNTGYYIDPASTSIVWLLSARANQAVGSLLTATGGLGGIEIYGGGGGNAAFMNFHRPGVYASYFGIDTDNQFAVGGWSAGAALALFKCANIGLGGAASSGNVRLTLRAATSNTGGNMLEMYNSAGVLKTRIEDRGGQNWIVQDSVGAECGTIRYATPTGRIGILFFDQNGESRSDIRHILTGGFAFAGNAGSGIPSEMMRITPASLDVYANITATGTITSTSDIKLKKNLEIIPNALDKIRQLNGYTFERTDSGATQTGLIAQEVQKVLPEAVSNGEHLSVAYGNMAGLFVEAIKELKQELDSSKAMIAELQKEIKELKK
jgi:hypothetical protein